MCVGAERLVVLAESNGEATSASFTSPWWICCTSTTCNEAKVALLYVFVLWRLASPSSSSFFPRSPWESAARLVSIEIHSSTWSLSRKSVNRMACPIQLHYPTSTCRSLQSLLTTTHGKPNFDLGGSLFLPRATYWRPRCPPTMSTPPESARYVHMAATYAPTTTKRCPLLFSQIGLLLERPSYLACAFGPVLRHRSSPESASLGVRHNFNCSVAARQSCEDYEP